MSKVFKNHIQELGGNDVSYFKNTYNDKMFSNSGKSGDLLEILSQIANRLSSVEKNIDYIKNFIFQSYNNQGTIDFQTIKTADNLFTHNIQSNQRVLTPNFKNVNKIGFNNVPKAQIEMQEKQDSEEPHELSKKSQKSLLSHKSFGSFKGKQTSEEALNQNNNEKNKKSYFKESQNLSEKDMINSQEATISDLILSEKNVKVEPKKVNKNEKVAQENKPLNKPKKKKKNNKKYYKNYNNSNYYSSKNQNYYNGYNKFRDDYEYEYEDGDYYY